MSAIRLTWACITLGFMLALGAAVALAVGTARAHLVDDLRPAPQAGVPGVPAWFARAVAGEAAAPVAAAAPADAPARAERALQLLWTLCWTVGLAVAAAGAGVVLALAAVLRWARRPLDDFQDQVRALAERRFVSIAEPGVSEWVDLSKALNVLVARVGLMLDEKESRLDAMKAQMAQDALTGVASRAHLMERLGQALAAAEPGALAIVRLHDLVGMNQRAGRERTDDFLRAAATALRTRLYPLQAQGALLARLNGADFCVLLPMHGEAALRDWLAATSGALAALHDDLIAESWQVAWIGATSWRGGEPLGDVMTRADTMVMAAETRGQPWCLTSPAEPLHLIAVAQWRLMLEAALQTGRVQLACFPVVDAADRPLHREAMLRLQGPEGALLPAHAFIPPAIRTGRVLDLDLRAIELALAELAAGEGEVAVNLSAHSVRRPIFQRRVRELLEPRAALAPRLWLEVDESCLEATPTELQRFAELLAPFGCKLGLEHFAHGLTALARWPGRGLHYLKLDRSFCDGVHASAGQQAYARQVVAVARALGLLVIAEGVCHEADAQALRALGLDGLTGPWVGARQPLQVLSTTG